MKRVPRRAVLGPGEPAIVAVASALEELTARVPKRNGSTRPTLRPGNRAQRAPSSLCVPPALPAQDPPPAWLPTARSGCACVSTLSDWNHTVCSPLCLTSLGQHSLHPSYSE